MEVIGLLLVASLFVYSGFNHIKNHVAVSGYAVETYGNCPFARQLGVLSGWPAGVFLIVFGVAVAFGANAAFYALAGFMLSTQLMFHRNLKDPANLKHLALLGALLALAAQ